MVCCFCLKWMPSIKAADLSRRIEIHWQIGQAGCEYLGLLQETVVEVPLSVAQKFKRFIKIWAICSSNKWFNDLTMNAIVVQDIPSGRSRCWHVTCVIRIGFIPSIFDLIGSELQLIAMQENPRSRWFVELILALPVLNHVFHVLHC